MSQNRTFVDVGALPSRYYRARRNMMRTEAPQQVPLNSEEKPNRSRLAQKQLGAHWRFKRRIPNAPTSTKVRF